MMEIIFQGGLFRVTSAEQKVKIYFLDGVIPTNVMKVFKNVCHKSDDINTMIWVGL